ncbi:hypothetical protein [Ruminococcus sp. RTP21484sp1]|uniref:hypothetical protein n=1 Tax=Ruminococcus sp. RTP21484sp1 TaxID=3151395 RepID=UPI003219545F
MNETKIKYLARISSQPSRCEIRLHRLLHCCGGDGAEPYDTYASEEGARILKDESKELVYYNKELDVYVLGVCHCGISWRLVCSSIPV